MSAKMCWDCGSCEASPWSSLDYCRRCAEKAGHHTDFRPEIDVDKLSEMLGAEAAADIIARCKP
jgi:hypothetical protein